MSYSPHLQQCDGGSVPDGDRVLLFIERQAIVQVIIRDMAEHIDLKKDSKITVVSTLVW